MVPTRSNRAHPTLVAINLAILAGIAGAAARAQCPETWVSIPSIPANGAFGRKLVLPGGDVIVSGSFTIASSQNIARYNPVANTWSGLGGGVNGTVEALALMPDGDVIVAGQFNQAGGPGGVAAGNIARVNPATGAWSALGTGTNFQVNALVVVAGGDVIAGGFFTIAGDIDAFVLAVLDPVGYAVTYPACNILNGDVNCDTNSNNFDIDPFVLCVLNTGCP